MPHNDDAPQYGPFFGVIGAASAISLSAIGAAYGTAKSGIGICAMAVRKPELIMRSIIPVVMSGIIAIYGLVVAVLIVNALRETSQLYTVYWIFAFWGRFICGTQWPSSRFCDRYCWRCWS
ncbi:v-type proton ATPase 16 kDa proteolipid subunit [Caerostris extrusa]|uniref:V-type proton ATPase proteolipid subunit n=1 Tax=Caerostris extrusa TaxID=172846 RepID=A0AAV4PYQ8_CAEEX|nr:v-type proton ATPase 16 kDa proteolipid subunit [Caerostris extrusa]